MKSVSRQVAELLDKAEVFDTALETADPAILTCRIIAICDLDNESLESIYQYNYPFNVDWLNEKRPEWMKQYHPENYKPTNST